MKVSKSHAALASPLLMAILGSAARADQALEISPDSVNSTPGSLQEITVTAQRLELLGTASTASEGVVDDQELQLLPQYRPGQLLETVPGLIVTSHSGEGKANQYSDARVQPRSRHGPRDLRRRHADQPADSCPRSGVHRPQLHDSGACRPDYLYQGTLLRQCRGLRRGRFRARRLSGRDPGSDHQPPWAPWGFSGSSVRSRNLGERPSCSPPWRFSITTVPS